MADAVQKKPGFIARVKRFFRDIKGETKKIVWPTKSQIINNTIIVLVVMVIAAVVVGCLDIVASTFVRVFVNFI